jgi:putative Mn2+ efflux pump MntP
MWQIFTGSIVLSIIHALIPNHWLPLIGIGRTEQWSRRETLSAALITALAHIASTILIGILVGFIGFKLSGAFELISTIIAPLVLIILGLVYIILDLRQAGRHDHHHFTVNKSNKTRFAILVTLSLAMFLSPCIELEAYYFQAGTYGWTGILTVSAVYALVTPSLMVMLVYLGLSGLDRFNWHFLEHHVRKITGVVLIILGCLAFFLH